jgi:hypothetical protein
VPGIEALLPNPDVVTRHEITLPVPPERALDVALATPAQPDGVVRARFLLRGFRMALGFRAEPVGEGSRLLTETRVAAVDDRARRAFLRYWRVVRPFSGLVRKRWLVAVGKRATT